jgi:hypothetical protein
MNQARSTGRRLMPTAVPIVPTPALSRGQAFVRQCGGCGTLVYVPWPPASQTLGACSACGRTDWWPMSLPVGPFPATPRDAEIR